MSFHALLVRLGAALMLACAPQAHAQGRITLVDRIVAVVNNEVVTQWIAERHGAQALDALERRADAIAQRYRGREQEWFEARRVERNRAQRDRARHRGSRSSTNRGLLAPTGP